ncbi:MAG: hypothetical protein FJ109_16725 [Deltaproteobacteria bacterium]|nr:hypothetical protein [Deltaproteobacteria bacterium]
MTGRAGGWLVISISLLLAGSPARAQSIRTESGAAEGERPGSPPPSGPNAESEVAGEGADSLGPGQDGLFLRTCDPSLPETLAADPQAAEELARQRAGVAAKGWRCRAALAEVFVRNGNYFWALTTLNEASADAGDEASEREKDSLALLTCAALSGSGQWEEARSWCLGEEGAGGRNALSRYYGGIAAFRAGDDRAGISALRPDGLVGLSLPMRDSASAFRTLAFGRVMGARPGVRVAAGAGAAYDSNALMAPEDRALVGLSGEAPGAFRTSIWGTLGYQPANVGRFVFDLDGNVFRSFYHATPADSINTTDLSASAAARRFGLWSRGRSALELKYVYRLTLLDGGRATLDDELFGFLESHSVSFGPSVWKEGAGAFSFRYTGSYQRFAELARNGWAHSAAIGEEFALAEGLSLTLAQSASVFLGSGAYSRYGGSLGTFLAWQPIPRWVVAARGTVQYDDYHGSRGYFDEAEKRVDWPWAARGEVHFDIGRGFMAGVFGGGSGRSSNIPVLDYSKWEAGLTLNFGQEGIR